MYTESLSHALSPSKVQVLLEGFAISLKVISMHCALVISLTKTSKNWKKAKKKRTLYVTGAVVFG